MTPHFKLKELTVTNTGLNNLPPPQDIPAITALAHSLEQVRALLGVPMIITSGYRNARVNSAVGGVPTSDHRLGHAADFRPVGMMCLKAAQLIAESSLTFDQLILERNATVIHISFHPRYRREVMRQPGGPGTPFYNGLI